VTLASPSLPYERQQCRRLEKGKPMLNPPTSTTLALAQITLTANALERVVADLKRMNRNQIALPIRDSIVKALECHVEDLRNLPPF
jgi:hypothetical protein